MEAIKHTTVFNSHKQTISYTYPQPSSTDLWCVSLDNTVAYIISTIQVSGIVIMSGDVRRQWFTLGFVDS